jgi:hypothetical protein
LLASTPLTIIRIEINVNVNITENNNLTRSKIAVMEFEDSKTILDIDDIYQEADNQVENMFGSYSGAAGVAAGSSFLLILVIVFGGIFVIRKGGKMALHLHKGILMFTMR